MEKGSEFPQMEEFRNGKVEKKAANGELIANDEKEKRDHKGGESSKRKEGFFRADQIDLKNLDAQLEKHLSKVWTMEKEAKRPKEDWEIDLRKLVLKGKIAQGTFGTVHRGVFDGQDVAGLLSSSALVT
eukprot:Gb_03661 [translate_table: standard]